MKNKKSIKEDLRYQRGFKDARQPVNSFRKEIVLVYGVTTVKTLCDNPWMHDKDAWKILIEAHNRYNENSNLNASLDQYIREIYEESI